jgi:phage RecT family recombinase
MSTQAAPQQASPQQLAIARRHELLEYITKFGGEFEKLGPRGMTADYYVASLELYFREHAQLLDCKPLSIATGMLRVAQTGLVLGVSCDLLPFKSVCQFSPRYGGIIELALQSGVRAINTGVVREGDHFVFEKGTTLKLSHQPIAKSTAPITHAYAIAEVKQGAFSVECMTKEQIDAHRRQFSKSWWWIDPKNHASGVIPLEEIAWYGKKTCVRQLSSVLPKNPRLAAALMFEKQGEDEEEILEGTFEVEREPGEEEVRKPVTAPRLIEGDEVQNDRELDDFPGRGRR